MSLLSDTLAFYLTSNYFGISALVVVLYDWVINLPREVETFWKGDASTLSTSLYFATRSVSLSMAALEVVGLAPWSDKLIDRVYLLSPRTTKACSRGTLASVALGCVSYIPIAVFSALRAYALSKRWVLSLVIFVFFSVPSATDAVRLKYLTSYVMEPITGCSAVDNTPPELILIFFITTRVCAVLAILADALLLAITWRVLRSPGQHGVGLSGKGLVHVMLRDGAVYFILLMILNATDLIFITYAIIRAASGISDSETDAMAAISVFRTFLPPVLVARFLLDLQEAHQRKVVVVLGSDSPLHTSSGSSSCDDRVSRSPTRSRVAFAPTLGALGATIDPADWDLLDDDDDEEDAHAAFRAQATCGVHLAEDGSTQGPPVPEIRDECTSSLEGHQVFTG